MGSLELIENNLYTQTVDKDEKMDEIVDIPPEKAQSTPEGTTENLQALREGRGLSLSDIFSATRISVVNLTALENGDFKNLPPPIYTKSIISNYSRMVGIDEKPLLDQYERHIAATSKPAEASEVKNQWPERNLRYWLLYGSLAVAMTVGIIVLTVFFYHKGKPSNATAPVPVAQSAPATATVQPAGGQLPRANTLQTVVESPPAVGAAPTVPARPGPEQAAPNGSPSPVSEQKNRYSLTIKAHELTWIRIVEDKKSSSEALLKPGEQIERKAAEGFRLEIGNAGGVDVSFQQKPLGPLGKRGEVVVITLPAEKPGQIAN
jgi:cytoskeletal protein RodZ